MDMGCWPGEKDSIILDKLVLFERQRQIFRSHPATMRHARLPNTLRLLLIAPALLLAGCGPSELHVAADHNRPDVVADWIKRGKNVDILYDEPARIFQLHGDNGRTIKQTPLMLAAKGGHYEIVKMLVDAKADVYRASSNALGVNPKSVFDYAAEGRDIRVVGYLLKAGDPSRMRPHLMRNLPRFVDLACHATDKNLRIQWLELIFSQVHRDDLQLVGPEIERHAKCDPNVQYIAKHVGTIPSDILVQLVATGNLGLVLTYQPKSGDSIPPAADTAKRATPIR